MPFEDGTGPDGMGPGTGRGLGPCGAGARRGLGFRRGFGRGRGQVRRRFLPEFELRKRRFGHWSGAVTYTYSVAKGKSSDPNNLKLVQERLRHANIQTASIYVGVKEGEEQETINGLYD